MMSFAERVRSAHYQSQKYRQHFRSEEEKLFIQDHTSERNWVACLGCANVRKFFVENSPPLQFFVLHDHSRGPAAPKCQDLATFFRPCASTVSHRYHERSRTMIDDQPALVITTSRSRPGVKKKKKVGISWLNKVQWSSVQVSIDVPWDKVSRAQLYSACWRLPKGGNEVCVLNFETIRRVRPYLGEAEACSPSGWWAEPFPIGENEWLPRHKLWCGRTRAGRRISPRQCQKNLFQLTWAKRLLQQQNQVGIWQRVIGVKWTATYSQSWLGTVEWHTVPLPIKSKTAWKWKPSRDKSSCLNC